MRPDLHKICGMRLIEKSCIRETKHLLTDADSSTNIKKNPASNANLLKNKLFLRGNFTTFIIKSETTSFHYFSPRILEIYTVWTLDFGKGRGGRRLNGVNKREEEKNVKFFFRRGNFTPFLRAKVFKSLTTSFHYFSPRILNL